jgi:hypothetical protein
MGGLLYITPMTVHRQDPSRGLSSAGGDGMETGSPCPCVVYSAHYGIPDRALVPSFPPVLCAPLLPPPRPVIRLYLAASLRSIHLCNLTLFVFFLLLAGPSQDMCFDSLHHQQY